jgi:hypothetical protein
MENLARCSKLEILGSHKGRVKLQALAHLARRQRDGNQLRKDNEGSDVRIGPPPRPRLFEFFQTERKSDRSLYESSGALNQRSSIFQENPRQHVISLVIICQSQKMEFPDYLPLVFLLQIKTLDELLADDGGHRASRRIPAS